MKQLSTKDWNIGCRLIVCEQISLISCLDGNLS